MLLLLEQAPRLLEDYRGLQALAAEVDWLTKVEWVISEKGEICVNFDIAVGSKTFESVLVFTALYPDAPAYVRPRDASARWSVHQYPSGTLCLEWGPDNWRPEVTATALVGSTYRLLVSESAGGSRIPVPSRHSLTIGQELRGTWCRLYLPEAVRDWFTDQSLPTMVALTAQTAFRFFEQVAFISEIDAACPTDPATRLPPELAGNLFSGWISRQGWLLRCDEFSSLPSACTVAAFKAFVAGKGLSVNWADVKSFMAFIVLVDAKLKVRAFSVTSDEKADISEFTVVDASPAQDRRVPDAYAGLGTKKVAIVGLGSVGSKIAVSLARSGLGNFVLVDDDILLPENLSRNQLDWQSIGFTKAQATRGAIQLVNPTAKVSARVMRVAGQENASSNAALLEAIASCDLVIDATADDHVFNSLAAMCRRRKRPFVWGQVFAGGIGALMGRSVPGRDAEPLTVRAAIYAYLETLPPAPYQAAHGYDDAIHDELPLVAGDADVTQLAASMTAFAIDAVISGESPKFPVAAYLFGYSAVWSAFQGPFDTHAIDCPRSGEGPQRSDGTTLEALAELVGVLSKGANVDAQPTK